MTTSLKVHATLETAQYLTREFSVIIRYCVTLKNQTKPADNRSQIRCTQAAESNATNRILPHLPRVHLSGPFSNFQSCSHYADKNVDSDGDWRFGLVDTEIGCLRGTQYMAMWNASCSVICHQRRLPLAISADA